MENSTKRAYSRRRFCTIIPTGIIATSLSARTAFACGGIKDRADDESSIRISVPSEVENALLVDIGVQIDSPMSKDDFVQSLILHLTGPRPIPVATFHFSPEISRPIIRTRIRLHFPDCSTKAVWTLCAHVNFSDGRQEAASEDIVIKRSSNSLELPLDGGDCWY